MTDLGFSQNEIDNYTSVAMDPVRYTIPDHVTRDIPEECGTLVAIVSIMRLIIQ